MENAEPILREQAMTDEELNKFCILIANGNSEAKELMDLAMAFFHAVDDLMDTMEDGRPTMSKQTMMALLANAMYLYNCPFYLKHQPALFSIMMSIHNSYADVLIFENHPKEHLRKIADVIRCNGNELFIKVAELTGKYKHMRNVSPLIRENSWLIQHSDQSDHEPFR